MEKTSLPVLNADFDLIGRGLFRFRDDILKTFFSGPQKQGVIADSGQKSYLPPMLPCHLLLWQKSDTNLRTLQQKEAK